VSQNKQQQRNQALAQRDLMAPQMRERLSQEMVVHYRSLLLTMSLPEERGLIISGFWPIRSEINPKPLMEALRGQGAKLALPALIGEGKSRYMVFRHFEPNQKLVPMGFDTFGPGEEAEIVDPDIVLLPLAAFDAGGNRIGYGGGFYDRTLAQMHSRGLTPLLIGLGFNCQEIENITAEPHDIRLDAILTESGLRLFCDRLE